MEAPEVVRAGPSAWFRPPFRELRNGGAKTECVDLWMYDLLYCIGCLLCHRMGECVHKDDFPEIQQMLEESDGIVLGSPVYIDNVTGMMKTLFDRLADAIHC